MEMIIALVFILVAAFVTSLNTVDYATAAATQDADGMHAADLAAVVIILAPSSVAVLLLAAVVGGAL